MATNDEALPVDGDAALRSGGRTLVLASGSPRRRELLARWGVAFEVLPPHGVDETLARGDPSSVAAELALRKARWSRREALARGADSATLWVVGSDTVVALDGERLGKPTDELHAIGMLRRLSARTHEVCSAVAVLPPQGSPRRAVEISTVTFNPLDETTIKRYVASGDPFGKAGAYGIQSGGEGLVAGFEGCYYGIVGLPVRRTLELLDLEGARCDCELHRLQKGQAGCRSGLAGGTPVSP